MAVAGELCGKAQDFLPAEQIGFRSFELCFGGVLLARDSVLIFLEQRQRDGIGVIGPKQLLAFLGQFRNAFGQYDTLLRSQRLARNDFRLNLFLKAADPTLRQLNPLVEAFHHLLRVAGHDVGLCAAGLVAKSILLPKAIKVQILAFG